MPLLKSEDTTVICIICFKFSAYVSDSIFRVTVGAVKYIEIAVAVRVQMWRAKLLVRLALPEDINITETSVYNIRVCLSLA